MIGRVLTSLSRTTAKWPESCRRLFAADRADRLRLAALGDLAGDFLEGVAALVGEAEGDDRFVELAVGLFGVGDVGARERRVVLEREPARLGGFVDLAGFVGRVFGDEDRPGRDFDDDPVLRPFFAGRADVEVLFRSARDRRAVRAARPSRRGSSAVWRPSSSRSSRPVPVRRRAAPLRRRSGRRRRRSAAGSRCFWRCGRRLSSVFRRLSAALAGGCWPGWPPIARSGPIRFGSQS